MEISVKMPELTAEQKGRLRNVYGDLLTKGYGRWPNDLQWVGLWINGRFCQAAADSYWEVGSSYIAISHSYDEGRGEMQRPENRLAVVLGLMNVTGHLGDSGLMALVEGRIAQIIAGVYKSCVATIGQRTDGLPVERIAWSAAGVAANIDGQWLTPVTGEPVTLDGNWTVVNLVTRQPETVQETVPEMSEPDIPEGMTREYFEEALSQLTNLQRTGYVTRQGLNGYPVVTYGYSTAEYAQQYINDMFGDAIPNLGPAQYRAPNGTIYWGIGIPDRMNDLIPVTA